MNTNPPTPTYVERSSALKSKAMAAEVPLILNAYESFHLAASSVEGGTISGANSSRTIGLHLQSWCGHEVMTLAFWKNHCEKVLPFDFDAAKFFMSVARKMPNQAETLAEANEFRQEMLILDGLLPKPQRAGIQQASTVPALQKLCCSFAMLRKPFDKIFNAQPMDQWDQDDVRLFLSETEWLATERVKAEKLLKVSK